MKKVLLTCAAAGLLIAGTTASAAAVMAPCPMFHPWYVGLGLNHYSGMTEKYVDSTSTEVKLDKTKIGWNVFAGYNVTPRFGAELGFADIGKNTWTNRTKSTGATTKETVDGWLGYMDGVYYVPVHKCFKLFAKGGVDYLQLKGKDYTSTGTLNDEGKLNTYGMNFGFGAQFNYNQFGARLAYTDYQAVTFTQKYNTATMGAINMISIPNLLSLDVMYAFG